ncbi:MAG: 3',5'-cyclic-AMP phosphodiesterase [Proteobacteria bacterium]|nr:3',5'-cyclic-AMP phosphodiesterase [Pseudomonadota bacterium]
MTALTTKSPIRLLQITDTHLYGNPVGTLLKMNTQNSFGHVINSLKQNNDYYDLILATGDIAQDASPEAYEYFKSIMKDLGAPFRWIPGNHDVLETMQEVAEGTDACEKLVQINNWQILFLDTSVLGQVHGNLTQEELEFLEQSLQAAQADESVSHCIICLHHNPVKGNAGWMKDIGLNNGVQFFKIVSKFEKLRCIIYGHIHQDLDFIYEGIRCLCTPSTCIQFKPYVTDFTLDKENPGYRTFQLAEDGTIDTEVVRVTGFKFEADFTSEGY